VARAARAGTALGIHRATRNTRLGSIGAKLRARRGVRRIRRKPYRDAPRQTLPAPRWSDERGLYAVAEAWDPTPAFAGASCSRDQLSALLALTNGITGSARGVALRAAPSAGALYAGEVYVVAERVEGLAPGAYYYSVIEHALVPVRANARLADVASALERPGEAVGAAAAVVLSNVFGRYRATYANRGYRYAVIDSGHIGENLRLAAGALGLGARAPLRWQDDRLNALLRIDGREEAVCDVYLVGRAGGSGTTASAASLAERQTVDPSSIPGGLDELERYHEATKLVATAEATKRVASEAVAPGRAPMQAGSAAADAPDTPVHAVIRRRRSAHHFETAPLSHAALVRVLRLARGLPALHRTGNLELYAVAHRVDGLTPGLYRYRGATSGLEPLRTGSLAAPLVAADLGQAKSGEAAVALVAVANLSDAAAAGGARSYRHLLLDAGATAQRIYLGAEACGVAARNLAAYYDDELDDLLGLDGARARAALLVDEASASLDRFGPTADTLRQAARFIVERRN
jgi:SagB-type dehydrogenase family enzyme